MYQLVYYSAAASEINKEEIKAILAKSRSFNSANNITGCLLFDGDFFLQVLEGEELLLKSLYAKIEKDKRHINIKLLAAGVAEARTFTNWGMAYRELDSKEMNEIGKLLFEDSPENLLDTIETQTHVTRMFLHLAAELVKQQDEAA